MVDHQFGLQDVDPNLANNDDGFQEVVSRKAKNKQQKARAEISQKKLTELSLSTSQSAAEKVSVSCLFILLYSVPVALFEAMMIKFYLSIQ